ncbi:hypothetical protein [Spiroplasma diminutum]|uniref:Transmembrane protein n=1 Tax=Spiroplasma diminutum CUAS-1 TaxID=1276221 RepID=S5M342_9MOLU|nr:hypothetical protein [Spiroplasma diminutum]AGR42487.1 hypothetical protein SDIMI_v3c07830 [Spiroplasma diminutum CUAS-1]
MKKIKENSYLIAIFSLIFLTFPIQTILENKIAILTFSLVIDIVLGIIAIYFITNFITKFLKHAEKYNYEITRRNLLNMHSLNNNFRFYMTMFITLIFFAISFCVALSAFERTDRITEEFEWWTQFEGSKYINIGTVWIASIIFVIFVNIFLIYSVFYLFVCLFFYSVIKIVSTSNQEVSDKIYKEAIRLDIMLQIIFEKIKVINIQSNTLKDTWEEKVILISNIESHELKTLKKGTTPPEIF